MQVQDNRVVAFHYTLNNANGELLDSSQGRLPLLYLHGHGNLVGGLEQALAGRRSGDAFELVLPPEQAYGLRDPELVQTLPRALLEVEGDIVPGMQFQAHTGEGEVPVRVVDVTADTVVVDGNHPWAGQQLHFSVQIRHVREASREELDSGFADAD